jgi:hypothetical protein
LFIFSFIMYLSFLINYTTNIMHSEENVKDYFGLFGNVSA